MTCIGTLRLHRKAHRGPRRDAAPEQVAEVLRRRSNGQKPAEIATAMHLSKRTVYRYLAEPEPAPKRRIRVAVDSWPDADVLSEQQRGELVDWLFEELTGWHP
jgi:predicted transcriptional regulator